MGVTERGRRSISILQWDRFQDIGDFNTRYLHLEVGAPANLGSAR